MWSVGALAGFGLAARWLARGLDPARMAGRGILIGLAAFLLVLFAWPAASKAMFFAGAGLIGMGGGLFSVATLTMAMAIPVAGLAGRGLALGAWGAAQATAAGLAILMGGALRDVIGHWAKAGHLGAALQDAAIGYSSVYLPRDRAAVRHTDRAGASGPNHDPLI